MALARRTFRLAFAAGAALVAASLLWWWLAVPALVKYPTDVDVTTHYAGTFRLFVDPATAAPLASPRELPLTIDRHIEALGSESGASRAVVKETITQKAGTLLSAVEENAYVLDRRSMKNVADNRAYAFAPGNVVDRSGAYRLQLPMGTDLDGEYEIYKNETGAAYPLVGDAENPTRRVEGLTLSNFVASSENVPLSPAYLAALNRIVPLPASLIFAQLRPQLAATGIDFDKTLAGVLGVMSAEDRAALGQAMAKPVKLEYVSSFDGQVAVEPRTGTEVDVVGISETISARPVIENLSQLQALLTRYIAAPEVQAAVPALTKLAAGTPIRLFQYDYAQTPQSVADIAAEARSMRSRILLAERWVPFGALAIGLLVTLLAAAGRIRGIRLDLKVPVPSRSAQRA